MTVRVVTLPDGEDPDTFVAKFGREALEKLLTAAIDVFDRKVQLLERGGWFADLQRKRRALDSLLPTIRATTDEITKDLYINRVSEAAGIARDVLLRELSAPPPQRGRVRRAAPTPAASRAAVPEDEAPRQSAPRPAGPYRSDVPGSSSELALVRVMLLSPALAEGIVEAVGRLDEEGGVHPEVESADEADRGVMRDPVYRALYDAMVVHGADASPEVLAESLDEAAIGVMELVRAEPGAVMDGPRTVDDALRRLKERALRERLDELERTTPLAGDAEKDGLLREKDDLRRELSAIGGRGWKAVRR
jgi:DNA primase